MQLCKYQIRGGGGGRGDTYMPAVSPGQGKGGRGGRLSRGGCTCQRIAKEKGKCAYMERFRNWGFVVRMYNSLDDSIVEGGGRPCSRRRWLANYIAETRLMTNCTAGRNMYGEGAGRWESIVDGFKDYYSDWMPRNLSGQEGGGVLLFPDHVHGGDMGGH